MFTIDNQSRQPVYEQIISQVELFILTDILTPGQCLPSVRGISMQLSVNPNTVQKAFTNLDRRGIICSLPGRGSFVADNAKALLAEYKITDLVKLEQTVKELKLAGVEKQIIFGLVERVYTRESNEKFKKKEKSGI